MRLLLTSGGFRDPRSKRHKTFARPSESSIDPQSTVNMPSWLSSRPSRVGAIPQTDQTDGKGKGRRSKKEGAPKKGITMEVS
jgi:hypothetical protein